MCKSRRVKVQVGKWLSLLHGIMSTSRGVIARRTTCKRAVRCLWTPFRCPLVHRQAFTYSGCLVPKAAAAIIAPMMLHNMPTVMWSFLSMQGETTDGVLSRPRLGSVVALSPRGNCLKDGRKPNSWATGYRYWLKHDRHGGQGPRR